MKNISSAIAQAALRWRLMMNFGKAKRFQLKTPVTLIGEIDIDYKPTKRVEVDVDKVKF